MNSEAPTRSLVVREGETLTLRLARARLRVTEGPDVGESYDLTSDAVVGRGRDADIRLRDDTISRRHALFRPRGDAWQVEDLGSKSGILVDGRSVDAAPLGPGATVTLGASTLRLEISHHDTRVPVASGESFHGLVGASPAMREVFALLRRLAPLELPVLLGGETGTGKEELAGLVHRLSPRADREFVVVDCTQLEREHLRSELFGHVRGAFTGATRDRPGAFRRADGGTLFLDEIGELPLELQATLLRVLETGAFTPLGGSEPIRVDVRVVAATHRDLAVRAEAGEFRQDLYYRLAGLEVPIPPLRARGDDVLLLAARLLPDGSVLAPSACDALRAHPWPGNVRELKNAIVRAAALAGARAIQAEDLRLQPPTTPTPPPETASAGDELAAIEDEETRIRTALERCRWNRAKAAELLGIGRTTLWRKMTRFGLGAG